MKYYNKKFSNLAKSMLAKSLFPSQEKGYKVE